MFLSPWLTLGPETSAVSMMSNLVTGLVVLVATVAAVVAATSARAPSRAATGGDRADAAPRPTAVRWLT
ncbi:MAG: hypothetical protein K0S40_772 [Actinomycetospora sp.]|nr:hypothetical protein [Actinomycetospora sp.]